MNETFRTNLSALLKKSIPLLLFLLLMFYISDVLLLFEHGIYSKEHPFLLFKIPLFFFILIIIIYQLITKIIKIRIEDGMLKISTGINLILNKEKVLNLDDIESLLYVNKKSTFIETIFNIESSLVITYPGKSKFEKKSIIIDTNIITNNHILKEYLFSNCNCEKHEQTNKE